MIKKFKRFARDLLNDFTKSETPLESKKKWNDLASEHARYFIMSDFGKGIDENTFRETGQKDFNELIQSDSLLTEKLGSFKNKRAVEIGSGIGRITEFMADAFEHVTGLDISDTMVEMGKSRLAQKKNIHFISTDGRTYPLSDKTVDLVFSFIVFQHMADRETVRKNFEESARVLKNHGIMKVQLRGIPTEKKEWFYGPSFDLAQVKKILKGLPFSIIKIGGEHQKYFWLWLEKDEGVSL